MNRQWFGRATAVSGLLPAGPSALGRMRKIADWTYKTVAADLNDETSDRNPERADPPHGVTLQPF